MTEQLTSETFAIGEHAWCVSRLGRGTLHCIVSSRLEVREMDPGRRGLGYLVEVVGRRSWAIDGLWNAYAWQLIKMGPPKEDAENERQQESINV